MQIRDDLVRSEVHDPGAIEAELAAEHAEVAMQRRRRIARADTIEEQELHALSALVTEIRDERPSAPVVFPEHFDLGVTAAEVNYGFSPGDETVPSPYAYVGPWARPAGDSFWNLPFGAARSWEEITMPAEALDFFRAARHRLGR